MTDQGDARVGLYKVTQIDLNQSEEVIIHSKMTSGYTDPMDEDRS